MTKPKQNPDANIKPRIVGFVCNWGAYSGVEMAGVHKREYPASVKLVRVMCLGRLHLGLVLKAFELGADGVMLLGCPTENCHYESGMEKTKELFKESSEMSLTKRKPRAIYMMLLMSWLWLMRSWVLLAG